MRSMTDYIMHQIFSILTQGLYKVTFGTPATDKDVRGPYNVEKVIVHPDYFQVFSNLFIKLIRTLRVLLGYVQTLLSATKRLHLD